MAARGDALHRTAYLLTHDHGLAEDLVQTALAEAWGAWSRIDGEPDAYVRKVMVNTFATWWRRRWNGEHPTEHLPERSAPDHGDDVATRNGLVDALAGLPRRMRAVVVLRYFEDLTEAQTADVLGSASAPSSPRRPGPRELRGPGARGAVPLRGCHEPHHRRPAPRPDRRRGRALRRRGRRPDAGCAYSRATSPPASYRGRPA